MSVDGVATQGSHLLENWVKKYNLRYSDDGRSWQYFSKVILTFRNLCGLSKDLLCPDLMRYQRISEKRYSVLT